MKFVGMTALLLLGVLPGTVPAETVYRWQDTQGRVHYGAVRPAAAEVREVVREVRGAGVTWDQRRDAEALAARERTGLADREAAGAFPWFDHALPAQGAVAQARTPLRLASLERPRSLLPVAGGPSDDLSGAACVAAWRAYRESVDCFARFKLRNGSVRPEAYNVCRQLLQPTCNEPALPPQPNAPARTPHD